jgi:hypothetical protein
MDWYRKAQAAPFFQSCCFFAQADFRGDIGQAIGYDLGG